MKAILVPRSCGWLQGQDLAERRSAGDGRRAFGALTDIGRRLAALHLQLGRRMTFGQALARLYDDKQPVRQGLAPYRTHQILRAGVGLGSEDYDLQGRSIGFGAIEIGRHGKKAARAFGAKGGEQLHTTRR